MMHGVEWLGTTEGDAEPSLDDAVDALKNCDGASRQQLIDCARGAGIPENYIDLYENCKGTSAQELLDCTQAWVLPNPAQAVMDKCKGTSKAQLRECAVAGASAAATAACAPYGPIAAYACGEGAEILAGPIFDGLASAYDYVFGPSDEELAVQEHNRKVAELAQYHANYASLVGSLGVLTNLMKDAERKAVEGVQAAAFLLGLAPPTEGDVRTQFALFGFGDCVGEYWSHVPESMRPKGCLPDIPDFLFGTSNPVGLVKLGQYIGSQALADFKVMAVALTDDWLVKLGNAKKRAATMMVANAAAQKAKDKVQAPSEGAVSGTSSKKSGGGLLFLGALAVAGGAAYWIWGR